jgi:hypothetical protein
VVAETDMVRRWDIVGSGGGSDMSLGTLQALCNDTLASRTGTGEVLMRGVPVMVVTALGRNTCAGGRRCAYNETKDAMGPTGLESLEISKETFRITTHPPIAGRHRGELCSDDGVSDDGV